ncbi:MAG: SH3 domain-containing protein [Lachnospiraceae bacterium]|nr:SH3 domain-containing protein [Lachnospiraceae bacterium]
MTGYYRRYLIAAIVICILILGILKVLDRQEQRSYAEWAREQNRVLNAADADTWAVTSRSGKDASGEEKNNTPEDGEKDENAPEDGKNAADAQEGAGKEPGAQEGTEAPDGKEEKLIYVTTADMNVRERPDTGSEVLGVMNRGSELPEAEPMSGGRWIRIRYEGQDGYVSAVYTETRSAE